MFVGGDGTIKGVARWEGVWQDRDSCGKPKLTGKSKKWIARMTRRVIKAGAKRELRNLEDPPRKIVIPPRYASSIDFN